MSLSCTISEMFSVKWWRDLQIVVRGQSRSLQMAPFDRLHTSSYWHFILTMALSCIISEIKWNIRWKSRFCHTPAFDAPVSGSPSEYCYKVWYG